MHIAHQSWKLQLSVKEERKIIEEMKAKIEKKKHRKQINKDAYLIKRFDEFNNKYFQGKLKVNNLSQIKKILQFLHNMLYINGTFPLFCFHLVDLIE
jgi:hypothetical protein